MNLSPREQQLAVEIAQVLDDMKSLMTYERFVKRYSESYLREILQTVIKVPKEKVKNTRGAYFTFLVGQRSHSQKYYDNGN